MKKVLALILAALMFATIAVSAVFAADEYPTADIRDLRLYGQDNTYLGDTPIAVAPVIDGKVDPGEYQEEFVISKDGDAKWEYVNNIIKTDIKEYYAYDADNFYVAVTVPQEAGSWMYFSVYAWDSPDSKLYVPRKTIGFYDSANESKIGTWGAKIEEPLSNGVYAVNRNVSITVSDKSWREGEQIPAGTRVLSGDWSDVNGDYDVDAPCDTTAGTTTYEFKFSKKALATTFRTAGEDAADDIDYIGIVYMWSQKYNATSYEEADTTRKWYPQTDENGDNATYVLDDEGLGGGWYPHFIFAYAEPEMPETEPAETDPVTEAPSATTAAPAGTTAAPTAATTVAPATDAPATTEAPAKKGCGGTLTLSALAILPVIAGGVIVARKKED